MTVEDARDPAAAPRPGIGKYIPAAVFLTVCATFFLGEAGHSLPSHLGGALGLAAGALVALWVAWLARDGGYLSPANPRFSQLERAKWVTANAPVRILAFSLFTFLMVFQALEAGVFWVLDDTFGAPARQEVTITGWTFGGRSTCAHFEIAERTYNLNPPVCADSTFRDDAVPGRKLILTGRATPLGISIQSWRLGPKPPPNDPAA